MFGWFFLAFVTLLACLVLLASDQPGHRRRRQHTQYEGPERREDDTVADLFERPIFSTKYCDICDKMRRKQAYDRKNCEAGSNQEP